VININLGLISHRYRDTLCVIEIEGGGNARRQKFSRKGHFRAQERSLGGSKMLKNVKITYTNSIWGLITPKSITTTPYSCILLENTLVWLLYSVCTLALC